MNKELQDMSFNELVKLGIELELDAIVTGDSLKSRVYSLMTIAVQWSHEKSKKESNNNKFSDTRKYIKTWDDSKGSQSEYLLNFLREIYTELTAAEISNKTGISINSVRANLYQFLKKDLVSKIIPVGGNKNQTHWIAK